MDKSINEHIFDDIKRIKYLKQIIPNYKDKNIINFFGSRLLYNNNEFIIFLFNNLDECEMIYKQFISLIIDYYINSLVSLNTVRAKIRVSDVLIYKINNLETLAKKYLFNKSDNIILIFSYFIQLITDNL